VTHATPLKKVSHAVTTHKPLKKVFTILGATPLKKGRISQSPAFEKRP